MVEINNNGMKRNPPWTYKVVRRGRKWSRGGAANTKETDAKEGQLKNWQGVARDRRVDQTLLQTSYYTQVTGGWVLLLSTRYGCWNESRTQTLKAGIENTTIATTKPSHHDCNLPQPERKETCVVCLHRGHVACLVVMVTMLQPADTPWLQFWMCVFCYCLFLVRFLKASWNIFT